MVDVGAAAGAPSKVCHRRVAIVTAVAIAMSLQNSQRVNDTAEWDPRLAQLSRAAGDLRQCDVDHSAHGLGPYKGGVKERLQSFLEGVIAILSY